MEIQLPKYVVETLTEDMLPWFVETAAVNMLSDELGRPELVDVPYLYHLARQGMESKSAFIVKVEGAPVGAIGGLFTINPFTPKFMTLAELFWYVLPEYRSTRAGLLLLKAFENRGKEAEVDDITLSLLPHSDVNIDSMGRQGYNLEELGFRKFL